MDSARLVAVRIKAVVVGVLTVMLAVGSAVASDVGRAPTAAAATSAVASRGSGVTADALPTVQVNGIVWTQVVVGTTVYAGGQFSTARPAGSAAGRNTVRRTNLLAFDVRTGRLISSFAPTVNGAVRALAVSPDKRTLYVGGAFTSVNGKKRLRFAVLTTGTGALRGPAPAFNDQVRAIVATSSTAYVGGTFSTVGTAKRSRLAAINLTTGKARAWKPAANGDVLALTLTPDRRSIVAGGSFSRVGKYAACGMSRLSLSKGTLQAWPINSVVRDCGKGTAIMSLTADATRVYGGGYNYRGKGNYEGVFAATGTGRVAWLQDCRGDTYDVAVAGGRVYSVGHAHDCANIGGFPEVRPRANYRALAVTTTATGTITPASSGSTAFRGKPSPSLVSWFPSLTPGTFTGQSQAAWSVVAAGPYIVLGGEFTAVNGVPQQGLVRMAAASYAPRKQGPVGASAGARPTVTANADRSATVSWTTVWDRDDRSLSYALLRDGVMVRQITATSLFWRRSTLSYRDSSLEPGRRYSWNVVVTDPDQNAATSAATTFTQPPVSSPSPQPTSAATGG